MIKFDEKNRIFYLETNNTSYIFGLLKDKHPVHIYWGSKIAEISSFEDAVPVDVRAFCTVDEKNQIPEETLTMEFAALGTDVRTPSFHAFYEDGTGLSKLSYKSYKIFNGKPALKGLPAIYTESDSEAQTLELELADDLKGLSIFVCYSVLPQYDVITKSVRVKNNGNEKIKLSRVMSSTVDFRSEDFDFIHLAGAWATERHISREAVMTGIQMIDSKRGSSSHHHNPFFALASKGADEENGNVYGFSLMYSGNFVAGTEKTYYDITRAFIGINPFNFGWNLNPGDEFQSPEAVLVYSDRGIGKMSRLFHKVARERICRGKYRDEMRPVLINNWEATYFEFTESDIISIAKKAKEAGVELMVPDDGWFGKRDGGNSSLGDWVPYKEKLPDGIEGLAGKIENMGMKFGLWFEPEMISPDSDLYRAHPDWCLHVKGRERTLGRNQLILDFTREDVREYIKNAVCSILSTAPVSYVKWDFNRNMSEVGSALLDEEHQCEVYHRYVLGVYEVMEHILKNHPDVLFEGCSGGGGRFDLGWLYYMPQLWTSDDSDAIERLEIQEGTSMVYPACTMGAHVSAVPNHQVGRNTPLNTRGLVAMSGQFGYELDLAKLSDEEFEEVKEQIKLYKEIRETVQHGEMYRLKSPQKDNCAAWEYVKDDDVVLFYHNILARANSPYERVKLCGLDENAKYKDLETGKIYGGDYLSKFGIYKTHGSEFTSEIIRFKKIQ